MAKITLVTFYIAGMKYYVSEGYSDRFHAGDIIKLEPEPNNTFDPHAVEVLWQGKNRVMRKVGYIPQLISKEVSTYIAAGRNLKAEITEDAKAKITIFEEKDEGHG